jgi:hypothetical protein
MSAAGSTRATSTSAPRPTTRSCAPWSTPGSSSARPATRPRSTRSGGTSRSTSPTATPDILQQIEHGTLQLLAQHKAVGHAIHGIVEPDVGQYTHLGDAVTKTDGLVYDAALGPDEAKDGRSGVKDDRWAFTSKSTPLNYGSIAALAAASRALRGYRDALADDCLATAQRVWDEEHATPPTSSTTATPPAATSSTRSSAPPSSC